MWFARDTSKQNDIEMLRVKRNKYTKCNQDKVAISILILKEVDLINIKLSLLHLILIQRYQAKPQIEEYLIIKYSAHRKRLQFFILITYP